MIGATSPMTRALPYAWTLAAVVFVFLGVWAMLTFGITELYADQWRQYLPYVQQPFPASALVADNGHRSVFPALIRLAELHWMDGNQWLQLIAGLMFAVAAWGVAVRLVLRDGLVAAGDRAAIVALFAFAVFWLGNARMLLHGNESANVYLIILCLVGALSLSLPRSRIGIDMPGAHGTNATARLAAACALGVVATFSFGPGLAVFMAVGIVLLQQRRYGAAASVGLAMLAVFATYMVIPGGDGVRDSLHIAPVANLRTAATWLSSMWLHLLLPLIDVDVATRVPFGLSAITVPVASAWRSVFGEPWTAMAPFIAAGIAGLVWLSWLNLRAWRRPGSRSMLLGLGIAWFAVAVAGIVALGREEYFQSHPGQVLANRYVPWSCLFWAGLFTATLASRSSAEAAHRRTRFRSGVVQWAAALVLCLGLATSIGFASWSADVQHGVRVDAAGFASGVVGMGDRFGETVPEEVVHGIPVLRRARVSMFAWPEADAIGQRVDANAVTAALDVEAIETRQIRNRLGGDALFVSVDLAHGADAPLPPRLVLAADGLVIGIIVRRGGRHGWRYEGYADRVVPARHIAVAGVEADGRVICLARCDIR